MINIFGPSAAGKSTIASLLQERIDRLYTVDFDVVKHQISHYHWKRDDELATGLTYDTLEAVAVTGLTALVLLPPPATEDAYTKIFSIAQQNNYRLVNIEITAPHDVLVARYQARLDSIRRQGSPLRLKNNRGI